MISTGHLYQGKPDKYQAQQNHAFITHKAVLSIKEWGIKDSMLKYHRAMNGDWWQAYINGIALLDIELSISRIDIAMTQTARYKKTHKHNGGLIVTDKFSVQNISIKSGSGGWIWTNDLRVMSPTSYQTAPPRINLERVL